jgi:hypothetical protein
MSVDSSGDVMLFEIRRYHFNPALFAAYREWAKGEAVPYLARELDLVGFWVSNEEPAQIKGEPQDKLGSANVTWIIRWEDRAHRDRVWQRILSDPYWKDIFSRVPGGPASYLRMEAQFAESIR